MLFTTPTQWVALGVTLFAGWLFGLASSSGGKKWKRQLEDVEVDYAAARDRDESELRDAQTRIRELERELAAVRETAPAPTTSPSVAPLAGAALAGAGAATLIERAQQRREEAPPPVPQPESGNTWIPEGPPPRPLAMGAALPAYPAQVPAPVQEEVAPASTEAGFPVSAPAPTPTPTPADTASTDAGDPDPVAPRADHPAESTENVTDPQEEQPQHAWLPPHVRADPPPRP